MHPKPMTTRQNAMTNTRGIDLCAVIAARAIIRQALFCRNQAVASEEGFAFGWHCRFQAYIQAAKILCGVYK